MICWLAILHVSLIIHSVLLCNSALAAPPYWQSLHLLTSQGELLGEGSWGSLQATVVSRMALNGTLFLRLGNLFFFWHSIKRLVGFGYCVLGYILQKILLNNTTMYNTWARFLIVFFLSAQRADALKVLTKNLNRKKLCIPVWSFSWCVGGPRHIYWCLILCVQTVKTYSSKVK